MNQTAEFNSGQEMSNLFLVGKENPGPGLAIACLNLIVALALISIGLLLGVTVSLLAWLNSIATRAAERVQGTSARQRAGHGGISRPRSQVQ
jgi:hypothetical protein